MAGEPSSEARPPAHPTWCVGDVPADFGGTEHVSREHRWRPTYQTEVEIGDALRQVVYPDGGAETPAAIVLVDNSWEPGEVALTADDVGALARRLLHLRAALTGEGEDRDDQGPGPVGRLRA